MCQTAVLIFTAHCIPHLRDQWSPVYKHGTEIWNSSVWMWRWVTWQGSRLLANRAKVNCRQMHCLQAVQQRRRLRVQVSSLLLRSELLCSLYTGTKESRVSPWEMNWKLQGTWRFTGEIMLLPCYWGLDQCLNSNGYSLCVCACVCHCVCVCVCARLCVLPRTEEVADWPILSMCPLFQLPTVPYV